MAKTYKLIIFFFLSILFLGATPLFAHAASLSVSPISGTYEVGDRVTVKVIVSSDVPINAVSAVLNIPTSIFTIESVSKASSILNFWVTEPTFAKGAGILQFEGVKLGGFPGGTGTVVTATLRATKVGTGVLAFNSGQVLANDGQGTDVTSGMNNATFSVEPKKEVPKQIIPEIIPETLPPAVEEQIIPEVPQLLPSLNAPHIELSKKNGLQAVLGTTDYLNDDVLLTFVSKTGVKVFITGKTDNKGEFLLLVPKTLTHGIYHVSGIVLEVRDMITYSHPSNEIEIKIGNVFSDMDTSIKLGILILFAFLVYFIFRVIMYLRSNKIIKSYLIRDVKEVENVLDKSLSDIGKKSNLGATKDIKEAESLIKKELRDIDKL